MGIEGNDRSYRGQRSSGRDDYRDDRGRSRGERDGYGQRSHARRPDGDDRDDRGFFDRAGDEVRSWFGDEDAERRRHIDEQRDRADWRSRGDYGARGYGQPEQARGRDEWRETRGDYGRAANYTGYGSAASFGLDRAQADRGQNERGQADRGPRSGPPHDDHYQSWRDRQLADLDRDYDDYRRENQSRFESEFGSWRKARAGQREGLGRVKEHMEVVGSDGAHVGTVDHVRGDRILLAKSDKDAGNHHHSIPMGWIQSVDEKVTLGKSADEAKQAWRDEEQRSGLFGNDRDQQGGGQSGHNLNRSFPGTY